MFRRRQLAAIRRQSAGFPEHDPQIDRARVKRFVIAGHFNFPAVEKMFGGKSDTDRWSDRLGQWRLRDRARRRVAHGPAHHRIPSCPQRADGHFRRDTGKVDIVKAAVAAFPNIVHVPDRIRFRARTRGERRAPAGAVLEFLRPLVVNPRIASNEQPKKYFVERDRADLSERARFRSRRCVLQRYARDETSFYRGRPDGVLPICRSSPG